MRRPPVVRPIETRRPLRSASTAYHRRYLLPTDALTVKPYNAKRAAIEPPRGNCPSGSYGSCRGIDAYSCHRGEATPWHAPGIAPDNGPGTGSGAGTWTQVVSTNHTEGVVLRGKPLAPPWHGCLDTVSGVRQVVWGCFWCCGCWCGWYAGITR